MVLLDLIGVFKPKVVDGDSDKSKGNGVPASTTPTTAPALPTEDEAKAKPTRRQLGREIAFDLTLTRCSFLMDIISNLLIIASPAPAFRHSSIGAKMVEVMGRKERKTHGGASFGQSQAMFVLASGMSSFGTGAAPAIHSLTLCILQAREMCRHSIEGDGHARESAGARATGAGEPSAETASGRNGSVGGLFGAFAFLQSIGSMILGVRN